MNIQDFWEKKHTKYAREDWITKPTIFATQITSYLPKTGKLLELGCGQGADAIYFASKGYKVTACDFSPLAIEQAKSRVSGKLKDKIEFRALDLNDPLPFEENSFNVVYSHLALHYFTSQRTQELFDEIHKVVKPEGIFATLTNTTDDPEIATLTNKIEEDYYETPDGLRKRFFSTDTLSKYTSKFQTILLDNNGETYKDAIKTLIRYIGKKTSRKDDDFYRLLEGLTDKEWNTRVNDNWTIRDVVAHLVGWEEETSKLLSQIWQEQKKPWFVETNNWDEFNKKNVEKYRNLSPRELLEEWYKWQGKAMEEVRKIEENKMRSRPDLFGWWFEEGEESHYQTHYKQIKKALGK